MEEIRRARVEDLPAAAALLAAALGFAPVDAVPAWLMRTTDECGGVTLVVVRGGAVIGALHSIAGCGGLFVCGLAFAAPHRGRRLALAMLRELARSGGAETIRWTADPVNGRALRVYLSGAGARLERYRAGLHDGLRADPGHPQDDVDVVWRPAGAPPLGPDARAVVLPWSRPGLADRARVREEMSALLADGFAGAEVDVDPAARRCAVIFRR
jgi:predicted GNAT superfamily acetyltransferase